MILLETVDKYFNKGKKNEIHVINKTSLKLKSTGIVALLGASGSGKTTLLNVIGGLDTANKGKIFVNGQRLKKRRPNQIDKIRNLNIGYIFQDYKLLNDLTVYDNVAIVLKMIGIKNKKEIKKRVDYVLEILNIYRYRNRFAGMLSGGERQRVGIARAIVKDPNIVIADEPTGNLDSKNSLEIMNIIKSISKTRLVILVTHETDLAKFYATRIIEIKDGIIAEDYDNKSTDDLDYRLENNIYLKDFKFHKTLNLDNNQISLFSDNKPNLNLRIVIRNNNIYLDNLSDEKIEVLDNRSSVELIDDHYKKIDKSIYEKYEFNFSKIINQNIKKRYTSILNPVSLLINGFKKIFEYPFIKKVLLLGFMAASMFILFAITRITATLTISDKDFVTANKNYIKITNQKISIDDFLAYEGIYGVDYIIPGDSTINMSIKFNNYLQTNQAIQSFTGSLSNLNLINKNDLVYGKMPESDYEIVIDQMVIDKMNANYNLAIQAGVLNYQDYLEYETTVGSLNNFKIVGITNLTSPSIYANESMFINMLSDNSSGYNYYGKDMAYNSISIDPGFPGETESNYRDYNLYNKLVTLKKGSWPVNNYEVVINYDQRYTYPIGKKITDKINGEKLKVVGFYTTKNNGTFYLVNNNMIKYNLITSSNGAVLVANDENSVITALQEKDINAFSVYDKDLSNYKKNNKENVNTILIVSSVIIAISLIEIFLMIRSSFLSRIKEIGIYRAIGVKKKDIYKMFLGEILAISLTASTFGIFLMAYVIYNINNIPYIGPMFVINTMVILIALAACFGFNIVVGLLPVRNVISKTPAQILSRHDVE